MRRNNCPNCGKPPYYFSKYDTFACLSCDIWTEKEHCGGQECEYFLHITGISPSQAERSESDFQSEVQPKEK